MTSAPRLLLLALAGLLATLLLSASAAPAPADAACKRAKTPAFKLSGKRARKATLCLLNKQRRKHGMSKLKERRKLRKAAKKHTKTMLRKDCFSHECPGEADLVHRLSASNYLPCNCSWGVGENIAWGSHRKSTPKSIVKAWMHSPPHRENILNRSFEHIGIGIKPGAPSGGRKAATYTTTFGYHR